MVDSISKSYAKALMDLLKDKNIDSESGLKDLKDIYTLTNNIEINKFLEHPGISLNEKQDVIKSSLKEFNNIIVSFIEVLVENKRINMLLDIIDAYQERVDNELGILRVNIISKDNIRDDLYNKLIKTLENNYKKRVIANVEIDNSIIGGIKVLINGKVIDDTLLNKLNAIKDTVINGA